MPDSAVPPPDDPCANKDTLCIGGMHLPRSPFVWVAAIFFLYLAAQAYRSGRSDEGNQYVGVSLAILGVAHQAAKNAVRITGLGSQVTAVTQQIEGVGRQAETTAKQAETTAKQAEIIKEAIRDIQENPALPGTPGFLGRVEGVPAETLNTPKPGPR